MPRIDERKYTAIGSFDGATDSRQGNILFKIRIPKEGLEDGMIWQHLSGGRPLFVAMIIDGRTVRIAECKLHDWKGNGASQVTTYMFICRLIDYVLEKKDRIELSEREDENFEIVILDLAEEIIPFEE